VLCSRGDDTVLDNALAQTLAFVATEEEGSILATVDMGDGERAAEGATELVALEGLSLDGEEVAGVERVIADEFEEIAVELIGAGLGGGVEEAAAAIEFGGVGVLLDAEFL
jgi:hypothetical protein